MPLPEHRQRQAQPQPGPYGHQARHGAERVPVLLPVPGHDQVTDLVRQRHPQCSAGVLEEDRREGTATGDHVGDRVDTHCHHSSWWREEHGSTIAYMGVKGHLEVHGCL